MDAGHARCMLHLPCIRLVIESNGATYNVAGQKLEQ